MRHQENWTEDLRLDQEMEFKWTKDDTHWLPQNDKTFVIAGLWSSRLIKIECISASLIIYDRE